MNEVKRISTSEKVEAALKDQGRSKKWLAEKFGVVYETIYKKINSNSWTVAELLLLESLLEIEKY